jgi:hypothetical protein
MCVCVNFEMTGETEREGVYSGALGRIRLSEAQQ